MLYDEEKNVILFTKYAAIGTYQIQLTLVDDNEVDPKEKVYFFTISIEEREPEVDDQESAFENNEKNEKSVGVESTPDEDRPNFKLQSISYIGDLVIQFD